MAVSKLRTEQVRRLEAAYTHEHKKPGGVCVFVGGIVRTVRVRPAARTWHSTTGKPEVVRIELLGSFRVLLGARSIGEEAWRLRKAGSLVKLLTLAREHRLHREQVSNTPAE